MVFVEVLRYLVRAALNGVWSLMGTTSYGYWLVPIAGAGLGWIRNRGKPPLKRAWVSLFDASAAAFIVFVIVFAFTFASALKEFWTPRMSITLPTTPKLPNDKCVLNPTSCRTHPSSIARTSARASRLEVANIVGVPVQNEKGQLGFFFNIYYTNKGSIPVTIAAHRTWMVTSATPLTPQQEAEIQTSFLKLPSPPRDLISEIQPGEPPKLFFTYPDDDKTTIQLRTEEPDILAGKETLYLFVTFKYRDKELPKNQIRITEFCAHFIRTFEVWHSDCGVNRIYTAPDN